MLLVLWGASVVFLCGGLWGGLDEIVVVIECRWNRAADGLDYVLDHLCENERAGPESEWQCPEGIVLPLPVEPEQVLIVLVD
jgi:hypothetical protein